MKFKQLIFFTITLHSAFLSLSGMDSGVANMELEKSGTHKRKIATLGELSYDEQRKLIKTRASLSHTQYDKYHRDIVRLIRKPFVEFDKEDFDKLIQTLQNFSQFYPTEYLGFLEVVSILHSLIKQKTLNYPLIQYLFNQSELLDIQLNVVDSNGNSLKKCIEKRGDSKLKELFETAMSKKNYKEDTEFENLVINTPPFACEEKIVCKWNNCSKTFDTYPQYDDHFKEEHKPELARRNNKFHCEWVKKNGSPCNIAFRELFSLKAHINIHTKKYKCIHFGCNKAFPSQSKLSRHQKIHTKEKSFKCDHPGCNKSFTQNSNLTSHKKIHIGEIPFTCDHPGCNKSFTQNSNLTRHKKTHIGEKPYKCDHPGCDKAYTQNSHLSTHKKTHQPKLICDICGKALRYVNKHKKRMHKNNNKKTNNRG